LESISCGVAVIQAATDPAATRRFPANGQRVMTASFAWCMVRHLFGWQPRCSSLIRVRVLAGNTIAGTRGHDSTTAWKFYIASDIVEG